VTDLLPGWVFDADKPGADHWTATHFPAPWAGSVSQTHVGGYVWGLYECLSENHSVGRRYGVAATSTEAMRAIEHVLSEVLDG